VKVKGNVLPAQKHWRMIKSLRGHNKKKDDEVMKEKSCRDIDLTEAKDNSYGQILGEKNPITS